MLSNQIQQLPIEPKTGPTEIVSFSRKLILLPSPFLMGLAFRRHY